MKIIYTAGSRSFACLDNVVHRSSMGLKENFRTILIEIPDDIKTEEKNWHRLILVGKNILNIHILKVLETSWLKEAHLLF